MVVYAIGAYYMYDVTSTTQKETENRKVEIDSILVQNKVLVGFKKERNVLHEENVKLRAAYVELRTRELLMTSNATNQPKPVSSNQPKPVDSSEITSCSTINNEWMEGKVYCSAGNKTYTLRGSSRPMMQMANCDSNDVITLTKLGSKTIASCNGEKFYVKVAAD